MTVALAIVAAIFLPPSVIFYARRDPALYHRTLHQRWQERPRPASRRTVRAGLLRLMVVILKAIGWAALLTAWIAAGFALAAAELSAETVKALAYALAVLFASVFYAVDGLIKHTKHLLQATPPAWPRQHGATSTPPALPRPA
ncbi:hypothetical protein ACIHFD_49295 [Nonomuraea sp. NPDC051941]|uniref:hypothetical protein n=1 Tax=Nonomuraea sp. NPDC051941 TaxID=3364373 RepID=UPI0037CC8FE0